MSSQKNHDEEYVVEAIRDKKRRGRTTFYLIKWLGYSEDDNTWEPLRNCTKIRDMIDAFEASRNSSQNNRESTEPTPEDAFEASRNSSQDNRESTEPTPEVPDEPYPIDEFTIEKLKQCAPREIEIVGLEPFNQGIRVGVRALINDTVFVLDPEEVLELWPHKYVEFLEAHVIFQNDESSTATSASPSDSSPSCLCLHT